MNNVVEAPNRGPHRAKSIPRGTDSIQLFCTVLNGTLLGNPEAAIRFSRLWRVNSRRPLLVYVTDLPSVEARKLLKPLPVPDYVIVANGAAIVDGSQWKILNEYETSFADSWNLSAICRIMERCGGTVSIASPPDDLLQSVWQLPGAHPAELRQLEAEFHEAGLTVRMDYSEELILRPARIGKGSCLGWLCEYLRIPGIRVLVAGDSAKDHSIFKLPGVRGIVPENVQPELLKETLKLPIYCARGICAHGVLEGLEHYGVISDKDIAEVKSVEESQPRYKLFDPRRRVYLTPAERSFIEAGYDRALETLFHNSSDLGLRMTPESSSIETHDSLVTIGYAAGLRLESVRVASRQTLQTVLDRLSPLGLVPIRVSLRNGESVEYPTLKDDRTIECGCWAMIAAFQYVRETGDRDFLRLYSAKLQLVMDCLGAHLEDDSLMKTPYPGTVTGHILWCRANFCHAKLLELQKEYSRAAQYFLRAQSRREAVSTMLSGLSEGIFEECRMESDLTSGDIRSRIVRISPMGDCFRADVRRVMTAFLASVLDIEKARTAFCHLWNDGAARQAPLGSRYCPEVEWNGGRDGASYRNGGVWPSLVGMWVRMIHRLGYESVAATELYRLARLNHRGGNEWEFNQWLHGQTCEPMGEKYYSCTAASYVKACEELRLV